MSHHTLSPAPITPLNPPEPEGRWKLRELAGERSPRDQAAYLDLSDVDAAEPLSDTALYEGELPAGDVSVPDDPADLSGGEDLELLADIATGELPLSVLGELPSIETLELLAELYEGELPLRVEEGLASESVSLDMLTDLELRAGETADPLIASDEGATYVPPIDPPVIPARTGSPANAQIASGLGLSARDEAYDESHHSSWLPGDDEMSARVRDALRADSSTWQYADTIAIETRDGAVILRGVVDDLIDNDNLVAVASAVAGVSEVVDALRVRAMEARG